MSTLIEGLRQIIGIPDFYITSGELAGTYNYALMCEYFVAAIVLCIVVSSVFRLLCRMVTR